MKALLLRTTKQPSKYGGDFYYAFLKGEDGKTYRTCLTPKCRNFKRWENFIGKENIMLDGLTTKGNLIDADSFVKEQLNEKAL